jgi:tRNA 2-thiouridine synthesizing protein A
MGNPDQDPREDPNHSSRGNLYLDLQGLKCPLPVLRTKKALATLPRGAVLSVACTDPLAAIDIPSLVDQSGNVLEQTQVQGDVLTFRIRKT